MPRAPSALARLLALFAVLVALAPGVASAAAGRGGRPDPVHVRPGPVERDRAVVVVEVDEGWHVNRDFMSLAISPSDPRAGDPAWSVGEPDMPEGTLFRDEKTGIERVDLEGTFELRAPVAGPEGVHRITFDVGFQACKGVVLCLAPTTKPVTITVPVGVDPPADGEGSAAGAPPAAEPGPPAAPRPAASAKPPGTAKPPAAAGAPAAGGGSAFERARASGAAALLLLVFAAGVGVSFTPCVLPMVPITIGVIGAGSGGSRARSVALAATYVAGLALVYTVLGVVAGLTGMVFGSWLQSPWVVGGIALLFFAMGLAMFGLFDVAVPSSVQTRLSRYGGAGFGGALVVGMVGALVAGPCSGPVLVSIIALIGQKGEVALGALLMAVFSLGMGLIFLVAGAFSTTLIRPGPWMDTVKKAFGVVMWAGALYFASPHLPDLAVAAIASAMLLATAVYGWPFADSGEGFWIERTRRLYSVAAGIAGGALLVGTLAAAGLLPGLPAGGGAAAGAPAEPAIEWLRDEAAALERARLRGVPVMVDFTADWCAACKELEHITYRDPAVIAASRDMVALVVDATRNDDPAVRALLEKYEVAGLPTVLFLRPDGTPIRELTVTGFVPPEDFLRRMDAARREAR